MAPLRALFTRTEVLITTSLESNQRYLGTHRRCLLHRARRRAALHPAAATAAATRAHPSKTWQVVVP